MPDDTKPTPPAELTADFSRLSKTQLAAAFGTDIKTVTRWQHLGLPFEQGTSGLGRGNRYNLPDAIAWRVRQLTKGGLDLEVERAKLAQEQAEAARRKNAQAKGELIALKDAKLVVQRAAYAIRQKIVTSGLSHADKQALLLDIQSLRTVDFTNIDETDMDDGEATE